MFKAILLYLTILVGLFFRVIPDTEPTDFFPLADVKLSLATHLYFIVQHLILIILAWIIHSESEEYRITTLTFFALQIGALADYLLTYNTIWYKIVDYPYQGIIIPVTCNTVSCLIFGISIIVSCHKQMKQSL